VGCRIQGGSEKVREDLSVILTATLTLLGLVVGFTLSMAVNRYDQRKLYEEQEANAIGTEYVRAGLLPPPASNSVRSLLREYLDRRIQFYELRNAEELRRIANVTADLQNRLWSTVRDPAVAQPTPVAALVVSGMNDVLNSQGYTQSAWWNLIPPEVWVMMALIAIGANLMLGYYLRHDPSNRILLLLLPVIVAIAFLLIADIDSPRSGLIHVKPLNLISVADGVR
jgi:hypothetical protein